MRNNLIYIAGLCAAAAAMAPATSHAEPVVIGYVAAAGTPIADGAMLGLDEANLQGRFLGYEFTLQRYRETDEAGEAIAVLHTGEQQELLAWAAALPTMPIFNVTQAADALRRACISNLLHVPPSRSMLAAARAQWQQAHPEADGVEARAWHHDFVKFAARDLNKRFRKAHGRAMNDADWAHWAAVRIIADTVIRKRPADAAALLQRVRTELAFDGQKGVLMSFRATGQLRQPLLLVHEGKLLGEAPVRGVRPAEDLDSLGLPSCDAAQ